MEAGNAAPALQVIVLVSIASVLLSVPIATIRFRLPHSPTLFPFSMPIASFPLLVSTYATNSPWNKEPSRAAFPRIAPTSLCAGPPLAIVQSYVTKTKQTPTTMDRLHAALPSMATNRQVTSHLFWASEIPCS